MRVPVWLTFGIAILVLVFGLYRIRLALRKPPAEGEPTPAMGRGFYRMSSRTHLLIGVVYILLAAGLIATTFGWNPLGNAFGPSTKTPPADKAPTKSGVPIDQLPTKKAS